MLGLMFSFVLSMANAAGWTSEHEAVWDSQAHAWITLADLATRSAAGDIFVLGEEHATADSVTLPSTFIHHDNQVRLLNELRTYSAANGTSVSVGMEFLTYTFQDSVDRFHSGQMSEVDFLAAVHWGGNPFEFYRSQILFQGGGRTLALNIPAAIASRAAKVGPLGLTADERRFLPPVWQRGNAAYFERFKDIMGGHVPAEKLENYFWAQSLWDDTMAWKALEHRLALPKDILLIIVGQFHVRFGGGLPHELKVIGRAPVKSIVQIEASDWDPNTLNALVAPDVVYGEQADYIWVHTGARAKALSH